MARASALRRWAVSGVLAALLLVGCSAGSGSSSTTPPASGARTAAGGRTLSISGDRAARLRMRLDLLLGAHVLWLARLGDAALGVRTEELNGYGTMAHQSAGAVASELGELAGSAQAGQRADETMQVFDGAFLDYTTAAFKQDAGARATALKTLTGTYVPQMAGLLEPLTGLSRDQLSSLLEQQVKSGQTLIDALARGGDWKNAYASLRAASAQARALGDTLAPAIARRQSGRYPGHASGKAATLQATVASLLQEQAHLAGFAAAASVGNRQDELQAARDALKAGQDELGQALKPVGPETQTRLTQAIAGLAAAVVDEASAVASKNSTAQELAEARLSTGFAMTFMQLAGPLGLSEDQALSLARGFGQTLKQVAGDEGARNYALAPAALRDASDQAAALGRGLAAAVVKQYSDQFR